MARRRRRTERRGAVHVVELSHDALVAEVRSELEGSGMSLERFVRLGQSGELEDDRLRDLWLMAGPALASE